MKIFDFIASVISLTAIIVTIILMAQNPEAQIVEKVWNTGVLMSNIAIALYSVPRAITSIIYKGVDRT